MRWVESYSTWENKFTNPIVDFSVKIWILLHFFCLLLHPEYVESLSFCWSFWLSTDRRSSLLALNLRTIWLNDVYSFKIRAKIVVTERQLYSSVFHSVSRNDERRIQSKKCGRDIHATCALDHQSHSSPVIKGVWFQRWDKNKWKYGTVPFIKGDAWKAVVRWYRPVEPLQRSLGPSWCVYHLFPLRYTRKEDRICYDVKLFEIRSRKEGFNILTGVFRPCYVRVVAHISAYQSFYTIVTGI